MQMKIKHASNISLNIQQLQIYNYNYLTKQRNNMLIKITSIFLWNKENKYTHVRLVEYYC